MGGIVFRANITMAIGSKPRGAFFGHPSQSDANSEAKSLSVTKPIKRRKSILWDWVRLRRGDTIELGASGADAPRFASRRAHRVRLQYVLPPTQQAEHLHVTRRLVRLLCSFGRKTRSVASRYITRLGEVIILRQFTQRKLSFKLGSVHIGAMCAY